MTSLFWHENIVSEQKSFQDSWDFKKISLENGLQSGWLLIFNGAGIKNGPSAKHRVKNETNRLSHSSQTLTDTKRCINKCKGQNTRKAGRTTVNTNDDSQKIVDKNHQNAIKHTVVEKQSMTFCKEEKEGKYWSYD